jgi:hypothetical protein
MPSPRRRRLVYACLALGLLVLLAATVGAGIWFLRPQSQAHLISLPVRIRVPSQGARITVDRTQAVLVESAGTEDLTRFELWVDGQLVASQAAQADPLPAAVPLPWRPASAGAHTLVARAFGAAGATGRSRPVVVEAIARPAAETYFLPATLEPGQTIDDLAAAAGASPQAITDANPGLPDSPPPGLPIIVPVPADAIPEGAAFDDGPPVPGPEAPANPAPEPAPGFPGPVELQAAEGLSCEVHLTWSGGEGADSFIVSVFGPGEADFSSIAELAGDQRGYTDIVPLPAVYTYVVQASNATGVTESNLVALEMSGACEAFEVPPEEELSTAQFEALELITEQPFDRLYCYLGLGASRYVRIPADEDEFLASPDGLIWDIDRHASGIQRILFHRDAADPRPATIECWGWQGASLSMLGTAEAGWQLGPQDFVGPGFRIPAVIDSFDGSLPIVPVSLLDPSIPAPYDLGLPASSVSCLAHIRWFSGQEIEGGERRFMQWICNNLRDVLKWEWQPSLEVARSELTGFRIFVNRNYAADPAEDDPSLADWEVLGTIGSALQVYPIPRPPCGQTYGYKVQAFIEAQSPSRAAADFPNAGDFRDLPLLPLEPERVSEPSRTFPLVGGECPTPRVLVEIALDTVTVHNTWDECVDLDFECEDVNLEAYGEGTWLRQDAEGTVTEVASMMFWNERSTCGGFGQACTTSHGEGRVRAHDVLLMPMERIDTCTPESGCTGFGVDHHRFQTWVEDGDTLSFDFTLWDHDDVSGDDIWCGTVDDAAFGYGTTDGLGMTSFFFGPFSWEAWAGFDHRHADNPWDNDAFRHQDAECEIDIVVTALGVEEP